MLPYTVRQPQDDPTFLAVVERIVATLVCRDWPEEVYLVYIDNWFDHKWLRYSGYGVVAFPQGYPWIGVAKEAHHQEQLTFPPFTPNRVIAESLFCRVADGAYAVQVPASRMHCRERQRSAKNLHRRVTAFTQAGLFVWYSSGSAGNRRASMLVYSVQEGAVAAWYAGFIARPGWQVAQVKGIGHEVVVSLAAGERPVEPA